LKSMFMGTDSELSTELIPLNTIRVETALSRYPVHRLARKGQITIEVNESNGLRETNFKWKVSYNSEYGQPGPLAYKIDTLVINRRIEEATRPIPRVIKLGSLHDICRELGITEGKNVVTVKNALHQNASAYITAKIQYRHADGGERALEAGFTRYSVIFTGEKLPDGRKADGVYIILNDAFIQVINGAMTRPLDYEYLKGLPPAPQRFYELISYQMYAALKYDRPRAKLTYSEFCAHAPQTRHTDWESVRSQMNKVHRPHRESGYIAKVDFQQTTDGDLPDWVMLYMPGPKARAEFQTFCKRGGPPLLEIESMEATPELTGPEPTPLEAELMQRGVSPSAAAELVREHAEEKIQAQIERLDWQMQKKPEKIAEPAAYLVQAIKNDYAAPKGFISTAERQRRQEAKAARDSSVAEDRRREREKDAAERTRRQKLEVYLKQLGQAERIDLEAKALAAACPANRESYNSHIMAKFRSTLMLGMIGDYLAGKPELEQVIVEA
jgi:hypothetical protein